MRQFLSFNASGGYSYDDLPRITTRTFIGIMVAISGNVLISLALNLQKLAHKRVEERKEDSDANQDERISTNDSTLQESDEDRVRSEEDIFTSPQIHADGELQPLIARHHSPSGSASTPPKTRGFSFNPFRTRRKKPLNKFLIPVDIMTEEEALHGLPMRHKQSGRDDSTDTVEENEGEYLKSKLWWMGFLLMNVGEMGNFISYAFAPASVVAPLGTFALIANCFFAPLLLREHFHKRDLFGVVVAVIGAVTVVLASNASDTRLNYDTLLRAISQLPFILYSCIYILGAIILATLSEGQIGKDWVFVDIGLCALFGGFTVLSTKAISTLLTLQWIEIFKNWITYPLLAVLILTGIGQIRYLNRALMRFDSKVVIPVQFVLFTLSAIIGSAILYGDFQKAKFHQVVTFLYGCAATFAGVFIIAWTPKPNGNILAYSSEASEDVTVASDTAPTSPEGAGASPNLGLGTLGRRGRAKLVLPSGVSPKDTPALRHQRSGVGILGISPGQLLLVHSPPRDPSPVPLRYRDSESDVERGARTPETYGRRRALSGYGPYDSGNRSGNRSRDSSVTAGSGRLRGGGAATRVGSLEEQPNFRR